MRTSYSLKCSLALSEERERNTTKYNECKVEMCLCVKTANVTVMLIKWIRHNKQ